MTAPAVASSATQDTPDQTHPGYRAMQPAWSRIRDLLGGTDAVRAARELYLPKHAAETADDYSVRLKLGVLFNGLARTVSAMTGLVTAKDVAVGEDNAVAVHQHWENIDGRGTHGAVFARRLLREGMAMGRAGVLVDAPPVATAGRALSRAEEQALGVRPYWRRYRTEDIRDWGFTTVDGATVLSHLVLRESFLERTGRFRTQEVTEYRVLTWTGPFAITVERWREERSGGQRRVALMGEATPIVGPRFIPFALLAVGETEDDDQFVTRPPLLDLADINLAHYRLDTERRNLERLGCLPVPVRTGYVAQPDEGPKPIGPNVMMDVPIGGSFAWAEPTGTAFEPTAKDLKEMERRMAALGLAFLESDTRGAETAEAKRLDATAQNASLSSAARALEDMLETALGFHAEYLRVDGGSASVNMDFERTVMDPTLIATLNQAVVAGNLSQETFLNLLRRGRVLGDDFNVEDEIRRIMDAGGGGGGGAPE
jgi:Domain of unknown function (DUF4055)